jgi:anti-anti-sigma factor
MCTHPSKDREGIGIEIAEMTELVRGQEEKLLERLMPLVVSQSVTLELGGVERIDAAGIAALITLFRVSSEAGHNFAVANASPRVGEILGLVGLERILVPRDNQEAPFTGLRMEMSAA